MGPPESQTLLLTHRFLTRVTRRPPGDGPGLLSSHCPHCRSRSAGPQATDCACTSHWNPAATTCHTAAALSRLAPVSLQSSRCPVSGCQQHSDGTWAAGPEGPPILPSPQESWGVSHQGRHPAPCGQGWSGGEGSHLGLSQEEASAWAPVLRFSGTGGEVLEASLQAQAGRGGPSGGTRVSESPPQHVVLAPLSRPQTQPPLREAR